MRRARSSRISRRRPDGPPTIPSDSAAIGSGRMSATRSMRCHGWRAGYRSCRDCGAAGRPVTIGLEQEVLRLALREPFRIARSDHDAGHAVTTLVVELRDDRFPGLVGIGEGYPDRFYGETVDTMGAIFPYLVSAIEGFEPSAEGVLAASERLAGSIRWNGGAKCAIDTAMHDLAGKVSGQPVHRLLGLSTDIPPTDFTLGLDEPSVVAERARRAAAFPALKIKCGGPADIATLEAVRGVYDKPIRVDANTGWTPEVARQLLPALVDLGVELIEQPFPAGRLDWLRDLQAD